MPVAQSLDVYYSSLPSQVKEISPGLALAIIPLTIVLAIFITRVIFGSHLPIPKLDVPLNPGKLLGMHHPHDLLN